MGMGCTHPAIHRFLELNRHEQNLVEKKLVRIRSGEKTSKTAKYKKVQLRLSKVLKILSEQPK